MLQRDGSFAPRGNIFDDGLAAEHSITMSTRGDDHLRMISSNNTSQITFGPDVDVYVPISRIRPCIVIFTV